MPNNIPSLNKGIRKDYIDSWEAIVGWQCSECKGLASHFHHGKPFCCQCHGADLFSKKYVEAIHQKIYKKRQKTKGPTNKMRWMTILRELNADICNICGYNACFDAIDFHHPDPLNKKYSHTQGKSLFRQPPTEERVTEFKSDILNKYIIPLCSNCHREEHYRMGYKDRGHTAWVTRIIKTAIGPIIKNKVYKKQKGSLTFRQSIF